MISQSSHSEPQIDRIKVPVEVCKRTNDLPRLHLPTRPIPFPPFQPLTKTVIVANVVAVAAVANAPHAYRDGNTGTAVVAVVLLIG